MKLICFSFLQVFFIRKVPDFNLIQGSPLFRRANSQVPMIALTPSWIDKAKISYGGSFHDATVNDVKQLGINLLFIAMLIPYWLVYFQVFSLSLMIFFTIEN